NQEDGRMLFLFALLMGFSAQAQTPDEVAFQKAAHSTVLLRVNVPHPLAGDEKGAHTGTGFLVDRKRGWLLTNAHVSRRSPSQMQAMWKDGTELPAHLVYSDPLLDVSIIAVNPEKLPTLAEAATLDCAGEPQIGLSVGAFGNPQGEYFRGSRGIVSGSTVVGTYFGEYLHVDSAINHGNSGGPIFELEHGNVIGIVTSLKPNSQGMGYALRIRQVCRILEIIEQGRDPSPPKLALSWYRMRGEPTELRVAQLIGEGAKLLPFREGDRIVRVVRGSFAHLTNEAQLMHDLRGLSGSADVEIDRPGVGVFLVQVPLALEKLSTDRRGVTTGGLTFEQTDHTEMRFFPTFRQRVSIACVDSGSRAESDEFQTGDWVVSLNGQRVSSLIGLRNILHALPRNTEAEIRVRRMDFYQGRLFSDYLKKVRVGEIEDIAFGSEAGLPPQILGPRAVAGK
ncbi:MAG: trypsin-like peptidase domain-containing protein, partial [Bdellovibrionota bacterium]